MNFPESRFWNYSLQTYQLPVVEQICLKLQNEFQADVNMVLYCCWTGDQLLRLESDDITALVTTSAPWQDAILKPLRNARKTVKQHIIAMPADLLDQTIGNMKQMEINAEHLQQLELEKVLDLNEKIPSEDASNVTITAANLALYFQHLETVSAINDVADELTQLLDAIYQDEEATQLALMSAAS
jgi:uncharacterized protein (TIGR02444 family)